MNFIDKELFEKYANATPLTFDYGKEIDALELPYQIQVPLKLAFPDFKSMRNFIGLDPNELVTKTREPHNDEEIMDQFINLYGKRSFINNLSNYLVFYGSFKSELLEAFSLNTNVAIKKSNDPEFIKEAFILQTNNIKEEYVICRLINGFYDNKPELFKVYHYNYSSLFEAYGKIVFAEFSKYISKDLNQKISDIPDPIINIHHLSLIYEKYKDHFKGETEDQWNRRFCYPDSDSNPIIPISVTREARENSNRLMLLGILAAIQDTLGNSYPFEAFVQKRFGISDFYKAKSDHKKKNTFTQILIECQRILKK